MVKSRLLWRLSLDAIKLKNDLHRQFYVRQVDFQSTNMEKNY